MDDWQLPWHLDVLRSPARFKVIVAHRKARKTLLNIKELDRWAQAIPATYWLVFPTLSQGKKIVWDDPDMFQRNMLPYAWEHRNITDHYLQYPNGSKIYMLGSREKDSLRGPNPLGVIFDEYDDQDPTVWSVVQPILTANPDSWAWISGTYKGKKDLYAKQEYAKDHADWYSIVLPASKSGIIPADALQDARETTPQAFYDMEYECVPVEGGTSFFTRIRSNIWSGNFGQLSGKEFQLGIDLAKYNDWTVIMPVCTTERVQGWGEGEQPFMVGMPERFNQIDWTLQKARIKAAWGLYNKASVKLDATGVGNPVADDLRNDGVQPFEAITFTERMRRDLLVNVQLMLAEDKIKIPDYDVLLSELESFNYEVTKSGRITIAVPDGQHDDCVMSLALALWDIKKTKPRVTQYQTSNQPFYDKTTEYWNGQ